jgi:CubicO group peptidase (beta-lactamase class C family)
MEHKEKSSMTIDLSHQAVRAVLAQLEMFFEAERQRRKIPGLSVAVVHDQDILWSKGFGFADIERRLPATPHTIYCVASITKVFTATMLMQLRDAEKVHLDDPIQHYLPELRIRSSFADTSAITLRQVVSHLSGLPRDLSTDTLSEVRPPLFSSPEAMLPSLEIELIASPYSRKLYSNLGFALLNLALSRIIRQSFPDYVTEHILHPLQMNRSGFEPWKKLNESLQADLATPYLLMPEGETLSVVARSLEGCPQEDLFSSVEDMARFLSLQFHEGATDEKHILKGSTLREMQAPAFLESDWNGAIASAWELGRLQSYTTIRKGGSIAGFSTDVLLVPTLKLGIALFMNTNEAKSELNSSALEMLLPVISHLRLLEQASARIPIQPEWKSYEGHYAGNVGAFEVRLMSDKLVALIWETEVLLLSAGMHRFQMQNGPFGGEYLRFVLDEKGRAIQAFSSSHHFERKED